MINIDKQLEEFDKEFGKFPQLSFNMKDGNLVNVEIARWDDVREYLKQSLLTIQKETAERAVTLFQLALGNSVLPEDVWKRIANTNAVLLRQSLKDTK